MTSKAALLINEYSKTFDIETLVKSCVLGCEAQYDFANVIDDPECSIYVFSDESAVSVYWKIQRVRMNANFDEAYDLSTMPNYGFNAH